jgi:hypothetical protein
MAHYAFLDENNLVVQVISGIDETELIDELNPEIWYGNFKGLKCKRTSYNSKIRGTFAGVGYSYNEDEDIFIAPQPYPSWIRSGSFWNSPVECPKDDKKYTWDEKLGNWVEILVE